MLPTGTPFSKPANSISCTTLREHCRIFSLLASVREIPLHFASVYIYSVLSNTLSKKPAAPSWPQSLHPIQSSAAASSSKSPNSNRNHIPLGASHPPGHSNALSAPEPTHWASHSPNPRRRYPWRSSRPIHNRSHRHIFLALLKSSLARTCRFQIQCFIRKVISLGHQPLALLPDLIGT